jgi:xylulokinase
MRYLLGFDVGSSSVKGALIDAETMKPVALAFSPDAEMAIDSPSPGFAEQHPDRWWAEIVHVIGRLRSQQGFKPEEVAAIGVSYQMHGLVLLDREGRPLRPSIIWCDSRAVTTGEEAQRALGEDFCLRHYLNSPGNFTASKLKWVKDNEPDVYSRVHRMMLPGDYIAYRMTGVMATTVSGLSEGILWDYEKAGLATDLLSHYGIDPSLIPPLVPQIGDQGRLTGQAAGELGLRAGTPVTYRAGDQPNNALSLNVLEPGEVAATAGTSGVVYGVTEKPAFDPLSRVNTFVHANHSQDAPRYGILLCVNGTGILNSWLRRNFFSGLSYDDINALASAVQPGADGLRVHPFGNGAERILSNANPGAAFQRLDFNRHDRRHIARAAHEGIVFALYHGMQVMSDMGMRSSTLRAGHGNMFLSPVFREALSSLSGCRIELFDTDGAQGAARAAGAGAGLFPTLSEAFRGMEPILSVDPDPVLQAPYAHAYADWSERLHSCLLNSL